MNGTDKKTQLESGFEPVTHLMTQARCWGLQRLSNDNELVLIHNAFAYRSTHNSIELCDVIAESIIPCIGFLQRLLTGGCRIQWTKTRYLLVNSMQLAALRAPNPKIVGRNVPAQLRYNHSKCKLYSNLNSTPMFKRTENANRSS